MTGAEHWFEASPDFAFNKDQITFRVGGDYNVLPGKLALRPIPPPGGFAAPPP